MTLARHADGQRAPAVALVLACLVGQVTAGATPRGFVARAGAGFVLDGAPFHVVGANQCVPAAGLRGSTCEVAGAAGSMAALQPTRQRIATVAMWMEMHWSIALARRIRSRLAAAFALVGGGTWPGLIQTANEEQKSAISTEYATRSSQVQPHDGILVRWRASAARHGRTGASGAAVTHGAVALCRVEF